MIILPTLLPDGTGYRMGARAVQGFDDDPSLHEEARRVIARFAAAYAPAGLTDGQQLLLKDVSAPQSSPLLRALADDEADVDRAFTAGLFDLLSPTEVAAAANPTSHDQLAGRSYPLASQDVRRLTGVSARQLRYWEEAGLLASYRPRKHRRYLRGAVLRAFLLAKQQPYVVAFLRAFIANPAAISSVISAGLSGGTLERRREFAAELRRTVHFLDQLNYSASSDGGGPMTIVLSGPVLSRKSEVGRQLADRLGADHVSFGAFVREVAKKRGRPDDPQSLLDFGAELFDELGPERFVDATLASQALRGKPYVVIDDVLHAPVLDALKERFGHLTHIEVELPPAEEKRELVEHGLSQSTVDAHPLETASRQLLKERPTSLRVSSADVPDAVARVERLLALAA